MSDIVLFEFEGTEIAFDWSDKVEMINLTQMAKATGKQVNDWTRLNSTQELIEAWKSNYGNSRSKNSEPVVSFEGRYGGTWANRLIAIQFAQWCSPKFALWVSIQIDELLRNKIVILEQATQQQIDEAVRKHQKTLLESSATTYRSYEHIGQCLRLSPKQLEEIQRIVFQEDTPVARAIQERRDQRDLPMPKLVRVEPGKQRMNRIYSKSDELPSWFWFTCLEVIACLNAVSWSDHLIKGLRDPFIQSWRLPQDQVPTPFYDDSARSLMVLGTTHDPNWQNTIDWESLKNTYALVN